MCVMYCDGKGKWKKRLPKDACNQNRSSRHKVGFPVREGFKTGSDAEGTGRFFPSWRQELSL